MRTFVESAHTFHQEWSHGRVDHVVAPYLLELDGELPFRPGEEPIDGVRAGEASDLGINDLAVAKEDRAAAGVPIDDVNDARLPVELDGLYEIDHADVGEIPGEARAAFPAGLHAFAFCALQSRAHANADLLDVDGLGQVVVDAEFETTDFVLDGFAARDKEKGDLRPLGTCLDLAAQLEAVHLVEIRVGDDQIRLTGFEQSKRLATAGGGRDVESGFLEADIENAKTLRISVDKQKPVL